MMNTWHGLDEIGPLAGKVTYEFHDHVAVILYAGYDTIVDFLDGAWIAQGCISVSFSPAWHHGMQCIEQNWIAMLIDLISYRLLKRSGLSIAMECIGSLRE